MMKILISMMLILSLFMVGAAADNDRECCPGNEEYDNGYDYGINGWWPGTGSDISGCFMEGYYEGIADASEDECEDCSDCPEGYVCVDGECCEYNIYNETGSSYHDDSDVNPDDYSYYSYEHDYNYTYIDCEDCTHYEGYYFHENEQGSVLITDDTTETSFYNNGWGADFDYAFYWDGSYQYDGYYNEEGYAYSGYQIDNNGNHERYENGYTYTRYFLDGIWEDSNYTYYNFTKCWSDVAEERVEICNSAPSLGMNFEGSVKGDAIPILYTYVVDGESVTSTEMPTDHTGGVIVTPARTAGEPLEPCVFDNTAKGKRIAEWKANHAE